MFPPADVPNPADLDDPARDSKDLADGFHAAAVGLAIATVDGTLLYANPALGKMLGFETETLRGRHIRELIHPEDRPGTPEELTRLLRGEVASLVLEKRYVARDGALGWARTTVTVVRDAAGRAVRLVGSIENVTAYLQTSEQLREEREALALLHETGKLLVSTLEREPLLQAMTDAATKLTGAQFGAFFHTAVDAQTGEQFQLYTLSGAARSSFDRFGHPRATGIFAPTFRGEAPIRCDDVTQDPRYGKMAPHHGLPKHHLPVKSYMAIPVVSRAGTVLGALMFGHAKQGVFSERSERLAVGVATHAAIALDNASMVEQLRAAAADREQLLEAERAARSQAERESRLKDDFLATLSHELRTPLSAVLGWAQLLATRRLPEAEAQRAAESIARNARAQANLVDDLLDMNRVTSGKVRLELEAVNPAEIIQAAIDAVRPSIDANGLTLVCTISSQVGPVLGDPHRLRQVVWNLLSNSAKFTPRGGRIEVVLSDLGASAAIVVRDSGVGIEPEFLPHVFDRFRQGDSSSKRSHGGLGLGLSLVKSLVELHGGEVSAYSAGSGQGTEVTLTLPKARRATDAAKPVVQAPGPFESACLDLKGCHIMVVDDEPDARGVVEYLLGECDAKVTGFSSAQEALAALDFEHPDLIISDISMPGMDGYEFIQQLRQRDTTAGGTIPAVALTAFARVEDRSRALLSGFQAHVSKPAEAGELLSTVAGLVHLRPKPRSPTA